MLHAFAARVTQREFDFARLLLQLVDGPQAQQQQQRSIRAKMSTRMRRMSTRMICKISRLQLVTTGVQTCSQIWMMNGKSCWQRKKQMQTQNWLMLGVNYKTQQDWTNARGVCSHTMNGPDVLLSACSPGCLETA